MTLDEIVAAVQELSDAPRARIEQWVNDRYRRMVAESGWGMVERAIASTSAGVDVYPVEAAMVGLQRLRVGDNTYSATSLEQIWALSDPSQAAQLTGGPGVYAETFDASGATPAIKLYPVPVEDGLEILGLMAFIPDRLGASDEPNLPLDLHDALLAGVIAQSLVNLDARADLAAFHEQRYVDGIATLRRRRLSRMSAGPAQAQIRGYHFT